jgi:hypothetical protein
VTIVDRLPADLREVASNVLDPLELAAHLEVSGISNRVARDEYGAANVFEVARALWDDMPFVPAEVEPEPARRAGNVSDLGRGLVYGAPGLLLYGLQRAMGWTVPAWLLAFAVTWGWGVSQLTAHLAYTLRSRHDRDGERALMGAVLLAAPITTVAIVGALVAMSGDEFVGVLVATGLTTYMVGSAVLVLNERIGMAALCLAPGSVVSIAALLTDRVGGTTVAVAVSTSVVGAMLATAPFVSLRVHRVGAFARGELTRSAVHLFHGFLCGAALAVVVLGCGASVTDGDALVAVSVPLVLSLGVMEWQLRTFRAGAARLQTLTDVAEYSARTWRLFVRCQLQYAAATFALCLAAAILTGAFAHPSELAVLAVAGSLGVAYHLDVTLVSLGRVDLAMWAWCIGAATGGLFALQATALGVEADLVLLSTAVGLAACAFTFWRVASTPVCAAVNH